MIDTVVLDGITYNRAPEYDPMVAYAETADDGVVFICAPDCEAIFVDGLAYVPPPGDDD
ncbi:MAG: hypothetical protein LCH43_11205 [Actinobacteria bacterium]|nr:hypothetical protein [Actinomycetota bacterium]